MIRLLCDSCFYPIDETYYQSQDGTVTCSSCYVQKICFECGDEIHSYVSYRSLILCNECNQTLTQGCINLDDCKEYITEYDLEEGRELRENTGIDPYLIDQSNSFTIRKVAELILSITSLHDNLDTIRSISQDCTKLSMVIYDYIREAYLLTCNELKYSKGLFLSPVETLDFGSGNCSSKSALLASLLKTIGLSVRIYTIPKHCFVAVRYPIDRLETKNFNKYSLGDGSFIGLDPASNQPFKKMPESIFNYNEFEYFKF